MELPKPLDDRRQLERGEGVEQFLDGFGWVLERHPLEPHSVADGGSIEIELVDEEVIRVLSLDSKGVEHVRREVFFVVGDDDACPGLDCSSKDMAIVRVGEFQSGDQILIARDEAVRTWAFIISRVRCNCSGLRSGRSRSTLRVHSSWMSSVHRASTTS